MGTELYLAIVLDLFSRQIVGWSMKNNPRADLVIDALLMAIGRHKPDGRVLIHSQNVAMEIMVVYLRQSLKTVLREAVSCVGS